MVKRLFPVLLLLAAAPFLSAENNITIDMTLYNTVMQSREVNPGTEGYHDAGGTWVPPVLPSVGDKYWAYGMAGTGALSFKSTGNANVRADFALDFSYPDISGIPVITLQKAYVKAKFPSFRLTVGKTRLGWGDGFVFNSGDVVFGSISPNVNLVGSEVRTETAWMTSVNIPLGRFSFIELLLRAPEMIFSGTTPVGLGNVLDLGAGGRVYTKLGDLKVELGYYFDGTDTIDYDIIVTDGDESLTIPAFQRPYFSIQGNLGADFYLNCSLAIPFAAGDDLADIIKDTWNISFGLFHMVEVGYGNSLTFRVESVFLPFLDWREDAGSAGTYALMLYPEIAFAYGQNLNFSLRSVFSPIDLSAMLTAGFSWNVFEGFNLLGYTNFFIGDGDDTFSWNKDNDVWELGVDMVDGVSVMVGVQYIY
ncbi:hypothetical protein [Spirochaeta isovalerica]|uniref:Uncharacterized protein n=1 Tax=Spirochaeta isovalerica TaxID=150 RepID=A0A841RIQ5_9SPIO|nr:hypothetical protein [Spirochaeta isovalerica]MBB6482609.1 hypothetical protein [Spirochaeta isovalerica]